MKLLGSTVVGAWVDRATADLRAAGEFAQEVKAATAVRRRKISRKAAASGRDIMGEGRSLVDDITELADAARRARTDRVREQRERSGTQTRSKKPW
ncbi:hypothetical protein [Nocardia asteroides]|uniref:hypothetical protein n=1 Tax=Nocardia asteroides TaxID=1824 RepID=UPI0033DF7502